MIDYDKIVKVGIADSKIAKAPNIIRTSGLGSCVGVVLFDEGKLIAGLAHIMLPESSLTKMGTLNKAKYADTAIEELMNLLLVHGARKGFIKAKIAGGAQMFQFASATDMMRIGPRNVEAVKNELRRLHIQLIAQDVGGSNGRTIDFSPETSILTIRTVNLGVHEI